MLGAELKNKLHCRTPFLVQSALLGWFGGLTSLKHYGIKALCTMEQGVNFNVCIINCNSLIRLVARG